MTGSQSEQIKKERNQIKRIIWLINIVVVLFFNGYIIVEKKGQIKVHQKTQNLGIKRPKKSLKSFPGQIPPEHKIKEQANWLKTEKKLKVAPVPVIVFTKATIALPEEYRNAEGFYCFKGTWLVSLNDLKRFLEYLNSKIITD
ncbi:MAG: hypothetical protein MUD14_06705 [Hydrococcus sp. Prado102]|jgi:hypothetical protein|nr:hypothetical protein [Hydrococcus sp. Prado102]